VAQYDVFANPSNIRAGGIPYGVGIQSDLLDALPTRLTIPLSSASSAHPSLRSFAHCHWCDQRCAKDKSQVARQANLPIAATAVEKATMASSPVTQMAKPPEGLTSL
jgi:hypothetical protein